MDAAERAAWLRLLLTPDLGPITARKLLAVFGLPTAIFSASGSVLARAVPEGLARAIAKPIPEDVERAIEASERWLSEDATHHLLTLADAAYPQALLTIADPPAVLFAIGRVELLTQPALAIVGSRNATQQGVANAEAFAQALAAQGVSIVSGLALGIDAAAHRGALKERDAGSTIAVVGTGVDRIYPLSNRKLTEEIRQHGVVLSEYPLGVPAIAHNFPRRNRLIAGLSRGVLVVEAALRSGSLITARQAGDAGREVFAIPGSIHSPLAKGCHRLIKEGAKLVESAQDVLEELQLVARSAITAEDSRDEPPHPEVLAALGHDPVSLDTLTVRMQRAAGELTAALMDLELAQYVERLPGNRYQRLG